MPPVVTETLQSIYIFFRRFTWELYKSIQFRVTEYDIELQARGWSFIKRIMFWAAIGSVLLVTLLVILRMLGTLLLLAVSPVSDSVERIQ